MLKFVCKNYPKHFLSIVGKINSPIKVLVAFKKGRIYRKNEITRYHLKYLKVLLGKVCFYQKNLKYRKRTKNIAY